ncbi:HD domain-containing protein [Colletotrichum orchidophilum]|uniref:HD domain-containing protein n=1 Tax=Colletotrichum orchidophilum TaxID=1209926 RepID=A0A1G4B1Y6_9PEZI|nr:HD domain-containing protein [Colletotrichum orchidophilum]OHE95322.1 HD domain-containing protein [Colletotrichum orchidophilum]
MAQITSPISEELVSKVTKYVEAYMAKYDASHDFNHIKRVVSLAHRIHARSPATPALDKHIITLSALLHDVGDRKYLQPGEDASTLVSAVLQSLGAEPELAARVQTICLGVSYSSEIKDPPRVRGLIAEYPELAVVQDADRLDAIGAVGIGRCFTFGGAKGARSMDDSIVHFEEKLIRLEGMMKTDAGREMARERTKRLLTFMEWWQDEAGPVSA